MTALTRSAIVTRKKRVSDYHVDGHTIKPELHSRIVGYRLWLISSTRLHTQFFNFFKNIRLEYRTIVFELLHQKSGNFHTGICEITMPM